MRQKPLQKKKKKQTNTNIENNKTNNMFFTYRHKWVVKQNQQHVLYLSSQVSSFQL